MRFLVLLFLLSCNPRSYTMEIDGVTFMCKSRHLTREFKNCENLQTGELFSRIIVSKNTTIFAK